MRKCSNCGRELADEALFCQYCGSKLNVKRVNYCDNCGAELLQDALFCKVCGNKVHSDELEKGTETVHTKKKSYRVGIVGAIILLVLICIIMIAVVRTHNTKKIGSGDSYSYEESNTENSLFAGTPQAEALNDYFSAINNFDNDALEAACYPQEVIDSYDGNILLESVDFYTGRGGYGWSLGLVRGAVDCDYDNDQGLAFNPAKYFTVWESYPKTSAYYNGLYWVTIYDEDLDEDEAEEILQECSEKQKYYMENYDVAPEILDGLNVTYNILNMEKLQDCTVTRKDDDDKFSRIEVDAEWINDLINCGDEDIVSVSVDDIYVACIQVKWSYGDKLYGWDESWWDNSDFVEWIINRNITSENTYDSIVEMYANREYVLFVYQYNDKWYIAPAYLNRTWIGNSSGYDFEIE